MPGFSGGVPGRVLLDGIPFDVLLTPIQNYITPAVAKFTSLQPRYTQLDPSSQLVMEGWGGGLLRDDGDINRDTSRIFDASMWTWIDGRARIQGTPSTATQSPAGDIRSPLLSIDHDGTTFMLAYATAAGARPIMSLSNGPTWTEVTTAGAPGDGTDATGACVQGQDLFVAIQNNDFFRRDSANTWTQPAVGKGFEAFSPWEDDTVVGARPSGNGTYLIEKSTDRGATWTASVEIATVSGVPFAMKPFLTKDPNGGLTRVVAVSFQEGVWAVDVANNRAWLIIDWSTQRHPNNGRIMVVGSASGDTSDSAEVMYVNVGRQGILEIHPEGRIINIGLQEDDGLPELRSGLISALLVTNEYLIAAVSLRSLDGGALGSPNPMYTSLLIMNKRTRTWHNLWLNGTQGNASNGQSDSTALWITTNADNINRLYWWVGDINTSAPTANYMTFPVGHGDTYELSLIPSATSGYIVTPKMNSGFFQLPKMLYTLAGQMMNLSGSTRYVDIYYALDDAAYVVNANTNFTLAITFRSGPRTRIKQFVTGTSPTAKLGLKYEKIRFKVIAHNDGASPRVGTGPRVDALVGEYAALPPRLSAWRLRIYNPGGKHFKSNEQFLRAILRLSNGVALISFFPFESATQGTLDATNNPPIRYFITIASMTHINYLAATEGYVDIVVSEIVQSQDQSEDGLYVVIPGTDEV